MDNKSIKNPLLQTANYGFSLDTLLSNSLVVPVSKEEPSFSETNELDSFIGQENSSPNTSRSVVSSNSIFDDITNTPEQSVPLVVPAYNSACARVPSSLDQPSSQSAVPHRSLPFNSALAGSEQVRIFTPESTPAVVSGTKCITPPTFFNPVHFDQKYQIPSGGTQTSSFPSNDNLKSSACQPSTSSNVSGSANSYRLGNLKRPTYAPVPGLSSSVNVTQQQSFSSFSSPVSNLTAPILQPEPSFFTSSAPTSSTYSGNPSVTGPYGSVTTSSSTNSSQTMPSGKLSMYRPVYHHWFYRKDVEKNRYNNKETKSVWKPFSMADSLALEQAHSLQNSSEDTIIATDGGRYDVKIAKREKSAVYWEEKKSVVRRCSWFSKGPTDNDFVPYEEDVAAKLEEAYKLGMVTGIWNKKVEIGNEEVVMHNMSLITHQSKAADIALDVVTDSSNPLQLKPRIVKRGGFDDFDIEDGEPEKVDHLLFLVHGIGQFCDLKFRSIIEVVDEFRSMSLQLSQSHFQDSCELGEVNRIEILPVSWHKALHCEDTGVDKRLKNITLPSIPRLRDFSNDTILDVLFYTSPVFCQVIINAVASEINRLYALFVQRNPNFTGKASVGGHSLGSLIVFDLLSNQPTAPCKPEPDIVEDLAEEFDKRLTTTSRKISVVTVGKAGTGQPLVKYPRLNFHPRFFFAFGSPIACFIATRSNEILGEDFKFPTCKGYFNIFHPYDPIAYRIEPLIIPSLSNVKPVQIPHHKGRKRMHLELKDTVSHVGQRLIDTVKNTWNMVYNLAVNQSVDSAESVIQQEINQVLQCTQDFGNKSVHSNLVPTEPVNELTNLNVGCVNGGRRVDYVLQEAPVEYFNEYLFALASHLCYWTSRDTILLVLKEIYGDMGICSDHQIPQNVLSFDITDKETSRTDSDDNSSRIDTMPVKEEISPPPIIGFIKK